VRDIGEEAENSGDWAISRGWWGSDDFERG